MFDEFPESAEGVSGAKCCRSCDEDGTAGGLDNALAEEVIYQTA